MSLQHDRAAHRAAERQEQYIGEQFEKIDARLDKGSARMEGIEEQLQLLRDAQQTLREDLKKNTELTASSSAVTNEIRDLLTAGRIGTRVIKWAGVIAGACVSLWGAVYALTHGGNLPGRP